MITNGRFAPREPLRTLRSHARVALSTSRWAFWNLRPAGVAFLLVVEALTAWASALVIADGANANGTVLLRLGVLVGLLAVYGEVADRVERLWVWLHTDRGAWVGQGSILLFAGVLVLPTWAAMAQCLLAFAHFGIRNQRYATAPAHRWVWSATTVVLATLVSSVVWHAVGGTIERMGVLDLLAIVGTGVLYSGVNLILLLAGMYLAVRPPRLRELLPDRSQFSYEGAKLLLGVVGGVLVVLTPLLTPAVLIFAALLHRSTLVGELHAVASTDAKTGLLAYRAWTERAERALSRSERSNQPSALVLLDLDHFKRLNDTLGHTAGDRALATVGAILADEVRTRDCVGRYGGEEFVVFLPGTDEEQAVEIAQRLRERIAATTCGAAVTASFGVAAAGPDRQTLAQLIDAADAAMYLAKERGRNTVCTASAA